MSLPFFIVPACIVLRIALGAAPDLGGTPRLGPAWSVDLDGLGIRALSWSRGGWVVVAGPAEGGGQHRLFRVEEGGTRVREWAGAIPKGF